MFQDIVEVRHLGGHRLWLRFADGAAGEIDMAEWLRFDGVFEPLRDTEYFARVRVDEESRTICWPNDVDLCRDVLYSRVTGAPLPTFEAMRGDEDLESHVSTVTDPRDGSPSFCEEAPMPVISRFFGITIRMHANDHAPPHFHAVYGEHETMIGIDPPRTIRGALPGRMMGMVLRWAALHRVELLDNWQRLREEQPPRPIAPLE